MRGVDDLTMSLLSRKRCRPAASLRHGSSGPKPLFGPAAVRQAVSRNWRRCTWIGLPASLS